VALPAGLRRRPDRPEEPGGRLIGRDPCGSLDRPAAGASVKRGLLEIWGWASFPDAPTARVQVWLGECSLGLAQTGVARADVAAESGRPEDALAGFSLTCDLSSWLGPDGATEVRAVATSLAGERLELEPAPVSLAAAPAAPPAPARPSPRPGALRGRGRRVLVCTHQLCLGGASRYLVETLDHLLRIDAIDPVVVSSLGGPSREMLEGLGVPVHVCGEHPLADLDAYEGRVEELLAWARPWDFEAAFLNTISPLVGPGAEVAGRLGIPAVWAIHESFDPPVLWAGCSPDVRARLAMVLEDAAVGVFQAEATARFYDSYLSRQLTLPYGFDFGPIDALRDGFDRAAARRRLGVPTDAELVLCVGTIDPRKAQASLAQAFDSIAAQHPRAHLALAGAADTADTRALAEWVAASGSADRIELIPTTPEIQQWYGIADLLACPSRVESLPRVVVEAMAWELPVLATNVFGIPELIRDGVDGWLCEPGDTAVLAAALDRALRSAPEERQRVGRAARKRVLARHEMGSYARSIAAIIERAVGGVDLSASPPGRQKSDTH
jgi:glycosyltransferase involved in cell wall biosynthesis